MTNNSLRYDRISTSVPSFGDRHRMLSMHQETQRRKKSRCIHSLFIIPEWSHDLNQPSSVFIGLVHSPLLRVRRGANTKKQSISSQLPKVINHLPCLLIAVSCEHYTVATEWKLKGLDRTMGEGMAAVCLSVLVSIQQCLKTTELIPANHHTGLGFSRSIILRQFIIRNIHSQCISTPRLYYAPGHRLPYVRQPRNTQELDGHHQSATEHTRKVPQKQATFQKRRQRDV